MGKAVLATTYQSRSCRSGHELCGFIHDHFSIFDRDSVQLVCIGSRLKEGLNFARRANVGVDDGDDLMVTIVTRTAIWVYLSGLKSQIASQPRQLTARTNREFERYAHVEILEFVYTVICQTEEDLMKVEKSNEHDFPGGQDQDGRCCDKAE